MDTNAQPKTTPYQTKSDKLLSKTSFLNEPKPKRKYIKKEKPEEKQEQTKPINKIIVKFNF